MLKIIDLFAGAGGLSLGAARAGFKISAAVETDPFAVATHSNNFPKTKHIPQSVADLSGTTLMRLAGLRKGELEGLIGGPPCQGFSNMGKRDVEDARNDLFSHFFRLVSEVSPSFFVAENVPGILDKKYDDIREKAFSLIPKDYTVLDPIEIKASLFGAPTTRSRIFFIGYNPRRFSRELVTTDFLLPASAHITLVEDALAGLPTYIDHNWQSEAQGRQLINRLNDNFFMQRIQSMVPKGVGHPDTLARYFEKNQVSGCLGTKHTDPVIKRFDALKPGQIDKVSKAPRLNPKGFCPTLRAGTGKDKGSYQAVRPIHYLFPRVITPREAARLQGFPDWFIFHETKWHSFRQIGNSVSPIVSEHIMCKIYNAMMGRILVPE